MTWRKIFKKILIAIVLVFALIGLVLTAGFLGVKYHLTDSAGKVDLNDRYFSVLATEAKKTIGGGAQVSSASLQEQCRVWVLGQFMPDIAKNIVSAFQQSGSGAILQKMLLAQEVYLKDNQAYQAKVKQCDQLSNFNQASTTSWLYSEEWQTLKTAIGKDVAVINEAGYKTDVEPRLIVALMVGEQLRLFNSEREVYKQFFQPLKILGNETKFSLGVTGVKEETAIAVEQHSKDKNSPFYLGPKYESLLNFTTADPAEERFNRLTDSKNHLYPYLYTALFIKQVEKQWGSQGFNIGDRPEILATLYNLGFAKSSPNANPQVGGSTFTINGTEYTFGAIAHQFYYSGELFDEFPMGAE